MNHLYPLPMRQKAIHDTIILKRIYYSKIAHTVRLFVISHKDLVRRPYVLNPNGVIINAMVVIRTAFLNLS